MLRSSWALTLNRRWMRWLTLLSLASGILAPALNHALAAARGELAPWSQVCTSSPDARAGEARAHEPGAPAAAHLFEHCPYCSLQPQGMAAPERTPQLASTPAGAGWLPALRLSAWLRPLAWSAAQPRAPPLQA